jgi:ADP-ribose pyrophosphatase YjhB (NUDIX family)
MYRGREAQHPSRSYAITITWPGGRMNQVHRKTKDQARELAEDVELKGARVKVVEWTGAQFRQLAVLDAFARRPALPADATHADKVAAIKADLARLAEQTSGRLALQ